MATRMIDADKIMELLKESINYYEGYSAFSEHEVGYYDGKVAAYGELLDEIEEMLTTDTNKNE